MNIDENYEKFLKIYDKWALKLLEMMDRWTVKDAVEEKQDTV